MARPKAKCRSKASRRDPVPRGSGGTLRRIRRRAGLTVPALAERVGMSDAFLSMVECNRRPISVRVLVAYSKLVAAKPRRRRR